MTKHVGEYLRECRIEAGLSIRDLCYKVEQSKIAGTTVSPAYYCQVEKLARLKPEKISMDFFWAVSVVLGLDPLDLFVMSRSGAIPETMMDPKSRKRIFSRTVVKND